MSLSLSCRAIIGAFEFDSLADVRIERDRRQLGATATVTIPSIYNEQFVVDNIKGGDAVIIGLGYNGDIRKEFVGYVADLSYSRPVKIRCEDEFYRLKRTTPAARSWKSVELADVLRYLIPDAVLRDVPRVTLAPFAVKPGGNSYTALQKLCDSYGLQAWHDGTAFVVAVPMYSGAGQVVRYDMQSNVIDPQLEFRRAGDVRVKVSAVSISPDNKRIMVDVGDLDAASTTTLHFYNVSSESELRRLAEDKLSTMKYDGMSGSMKTFGLPYVEPGMTARIRDRRFGSVRIGSYMVDAVTTQWGRQGFSREVTIGRKLSDE